MREICIGYFRKLDTYIEKLVELAGTDAQVFMASDHGFTASTEIVRINAFLAHKGYLSWKETDDSPAAKRREASTFAYLDWEKTLAYCRTPSSNGITIRVAQNPGDAGIKPEEYETFREKLIEDLKSLKDESTGEPILRAIHKREDVFPGEAMHEAPDLTLVLRDYGFVSIKNTQPIVEPREVPSGTHHPDGIFLAGGHGIKSGIMSDRQNIVDVPATLIYSLGLPVPTDLEGKVAQNFFTPEYLQTNPVVTKTTTSLGKNTKEQVEDISDDEKDKILAQLQMLGYME
jgi:predicted AlkP superfamily phosphohydrolase/phosphomutase